MSQKEKEQLQAELSILKELRHQNIVAYYEREHRKQSADLNIYMEYCGNGDLGNHIRNLKLKNQYAPEEFVWSIFSQLVTALYRCHYGENPPDAGTNLMGLGDDARPRIKTKQQQVMILHRDLKPENGKFGIPGLTSTVDLVSCSFSSVFLGADNSVKLGDFGLSKIMSSHDFASTYVGTPFYMSPEICASERYTLFSDIWGLGCIMYELCTKEPPFNARSHLELIQKIKSGKFTPLPNFYSQELQNVISSCLKVNPNHRPDTAHLLNLPIVKLMRKAQEVTRIGQKAVMEKEQALKTLEETKAKMAEIENKTNRLHREVDASLRREWEVKARLEIDRQVGIELERLKKTFELEVAKRVALEVEKKLSSVDPNGHDSGDFFRVSGESNTRASSSSPRSSTPDFKDRIILPAVSQSTAASADDDFPSSTDISSLSLDSPLQSKANSSSTSNHASIEASKPVKRSSRTPFTRARTMFAAPSEATAVPSPADIEMADPSPMSIASLSLSPRRTGAGGLLQAPDPPKPRGNIFAAASRRLEPISADSDDEDSDAAVSPTPGHSSRTSHSAHGSIHCNDDDDDDDEPDGIDDLPTPSRPGPIANNLARAHLTSALPPATTTSGDPFKPATRPRPAMARQKTMPVPARPTAATAPTNIFDATSKAGGATRPAPSVPVVTTSSPSRLKPSTTTPAVTAAAATAAAVAVSDNGSPTRRGLAAAAVGSQQPKKKPVSDTEELVKRVHRNNLHGRTLVELAQERVGPVGKTTAPAVPAKEKEKEGKEKGEMQLGSGGLGEKPHLPPPVVWDPERDEMPSPFLVRGQQRAVAAGGRAAWR